MVLPPTVPFHPTPGSSARDQADERIRLVETHYDLLKYQLDGWSVWPILRISIYVALLDLPVNLQPAESLFTRPERFRMAVHDFIHLLKIKPARYAVLVQSSNRAEQVGGLYKDIYFDDLLPHLGSFNKIENLPLNTFKQRSQKAYLPSDLTLMSIRPLLSVLLRLPAPKSVSSISQKLSQVIRTELGLSSYTPQRISKILLNFYWSKRIYRGLFLRMHTETLLLTTAYIYHAIVAAAKETHVRVVEFQHGLIDAHHAGYSWTPAARPYRTNMPIPDQLFLYGDYWKQALLQNGFWEEHALCPVGSLRIDQYRNHKIQPTPQEFRILLTTQNLDTQRLIEFMKSFLNLAQGRLKFHLDIKLHPGESLKQPYIQAFKDDERVSVYLSSEEPSTFELLAQSSLHLSIYSTCHFEALGLGIPTVVLPLTNYETMQPLLQSRDAVLTATPGELLEVVLKMKNEARRSQAGDYYFKPGALENMLAELATGNTTSSG